MDDTSKKEEKGFNIYSIHSTKGGVGKTSLAVAIACIENIKKKRKVLIIDGDLTGTSIYDTFGNITKEPEKWLNALLLASPTEHPENIKPGRTKSNSIKFSFSEKDHLNNEELFNYIPSSSKYENVKKIVPLVMQEDHLGFFTSRVEDLLRTAYIDGYNSVVIDTHPGFYGFSKAIFKMLFNIRMYCCNEKKHYPRLLELLYGTSQKRFNEKAINVKAISFFIVTSDRADYLSAFPTVADVVEEALDENDKGKRQIFYENVFAQEIKPFYPIINKAGGSEPQDARIIAENMCLNLNKLSAYNNDYKLRQIINYINERFTKLTKEGSRVGRFVEDFVIENVPSYTRGALPFVINEVKEKYDPIEEWIQDIALATNLLKKQPDRTFI